MGLDKCLQLLVGRLSDRIGGRIVKNQRPDPALFLLHQKACRGHAGGGQLARGEGFGQLRAGHVLGDRALEFGRGDAGILQRTEIGRCVEHAGHRVEEGLVGPQLGSQGSVRGDQAEFACLGVEGGLHDQALQNLVTQTGLKGLLTGHVRVLLLDPLQFAFERLRQFTLADLLLADHHDGGAAAGENATDPVERKAQNQQDDDHQRERRLGEGAKI